MISRGIGLARLRQIVGSEPSPLGGHVADLLDAMAGGLHHLDRSDLRAADWTACDCLEMRWHAPLSTYDGDWLTRLVVLCHDEAIRLEIAPRSHVYVTLRFAPRGRGNCLMSDHPDLETAIQTVRALEAPR